jgi:hypothetical protein
MSYCNLTDVKKVLHIDVEDTTFDTEITECITSADALVESLVKSKGISVPESVPQSIRNASKHFAAHVFRARRLPAPDPVLYDLGLIFLNAWLATYQVGKIE